MIRSGEMRAHIFVNMEISQISTLFKKRFLRTFHLPKNLQGGGAPLTKLACFMHQTKRKVYAQGNCSKMIDWRQILFEQYWKLPKPIRGEGGNRTHFSVLMNVTEVVASDTWFLFFLTGIEKLPHLLRVLPLCLNGPRRDHRNPAIAESFSLP